jgi:hypothetical protein
MRKARDELNQLIGQVSDLRLERSGSRVLVLWANLWLLGAVVYGLIWLVAWAFAQGIWLGLVHLILVAPFGLLGAAATIRLALEVGMAVLQIRDHVVEFGELPRRFGSWSGLTRLVSLGGERSRVSVTRVETTRVR